MKRLLNPLLLIMASTPGADKNLELLMLALQATNESVKSIKNGIDNFHVSLLKMASNKQGPAPGQEPSTESRPPSQKPEPDAKPAPSAEPETTPEPGPAILMPPASDSPEK